MNVLEKYEMDDLKNSEQTIEKQEWKIDDLGSADWALRKIAALESQNAEVKQFADSERERIADWEQKETLANNDRIEFFKAKLSEYLGELREKDPKARIKTPHGSVGTRKRPAKWEYGSDAVEELEKLGMAELIRIKKEVDKSEFKKAVKVTDDGRVITENGELIESIQVVEQGETLNVKVEK